MRPKKVTKQRGLDLNDFQIAALAVAFKKEFVTIQRWANKRHVILSTPAAQDIIKQFKDIPNIPLINV